MKIRKTKVNIFSKINEFSNVKNIKIIDKLAVKLRIIKIKSRLMFSLGILLLISIIVMALFSVSFSSKLIKSKVSSFSSEEMKLISKNIQNQLDSCKTDALAITVTQGFQNNLREYDNMDEASKAKFTNILKDATLKRYIGDENVSSVVVTDKLGGFIGGKGYNSAFSNKIINLKDNKGGKVYFSVINISEDSSKPYYGINLFREIKDTTNGDVMGYFWVNYKEDMIYNIYKNGIKGNDSNLIVIDPNGNVVSSKNKDEINKVYKNKALINLVNSNNSNKNTKDSINNTNTTLNIDNKGYFVSSAIVDGYNWSIVNMTANSYLEKESNVIKYIIILIVSIQFLVATFLVYLISKSILNPLNKIMYSIKNAGEGKIKAGENDLHEDELGEVSKSFNDMMDSLSLLIGNTKNTSSKISNSIQSIVEVAEQSLTNSEEVSATMNEIAIGATSQAEGMTTTINYLNNLSDAINQVEISLKDTVEVIYNTEKMGAETKTALIFLKEKSKDTKDVSLKILDSIIELGNYMKQIKSTASLIAGFSEQTNLLALNASIESARVGVNGRGFNIVSTQVKKLAIQSNQASSKIDNIIGALTKKIVYITQSISKTQTIIDKQEESIEETNLAVKNIITSMIGVGEEINQLMEFIKKIYILKSETGNAIEGISSVSEETAAITEQVTAITQDNIVNMEKLLEGTSSLNDMIKKLNNIMEIFEI